MVSFFFLSRRTPNTNPASDTPMYKVPPNELFKNAQRVCAHTLTAPYFLNSTRRLSSKGTRQPTLNIESSATFLHVSSSNLFSAPPPSFPLNVSVRLRRGEIELGDIFVSPAASLLMILSLISSKPCANLHFSGHC